MALAKWIAASGDENGFFPRFGGNSEHAHASYPGLSFRPPGFSPYIGREERRVQGLDYAIPSLSHYLLTYYK